MALGKKTGGRSKGTPNRATAQRQAEIAASGLTPLEYMLDILRDGRKPAELRFEAAKAAAPYVHPRLSAIDHHMEQRPAHMLTDAELERIAAGELYEDKDRRIN